MPEKLLGTWEYSHEVCDADSEEVPSTRKVEAQLNLQPDFTYELSVEGFPFTGTYRYDELSHAAVIQLDNWLNFTVTGETLENGSEGDAAYLCSRVFVRETR